LYLIVALLLLLDIVIGLLRVLRGPTAADRMVAAQLFGTTGVAILLLLAEVFDASLRNVALVFALLAALLITVFVKHAWLHKEPQRRSQP
ncbi:MAG: monovalent cation/H+ antiporter complex subunit F, partial [Deinococcota bacterium]|nr:monovalent cation/H+ antiporter complex subunit F [Deinococcota bacterium]